MPSAADALIAFTGCGRKPTVTETNPNAEGRYHGQVEAYDRQTVAMDRLILAQEAELDRNKVRFDRYEKFLTKWEEQARRMDALLDAEERKAGLKP